jgi:lysyl-tRNA synthetase class 2
MELTEEEKIVSDLLKEQSPIDLNALKEQTGLSNKNWDKTIWGLSGNNWQRLRILRMN